ncbi:restriction endonuclease subunit S [Comamonas testosteroni]|uniref:restriction endonuclease subunit S n=1 Tax=Comamonas testosteroni TaxID=285 RepID=UPI00265F413A|nr:restriction endonuclease subunit S [Comamonas testosteroni]WKL14436.1 restriction endonuclease subunit S [Comamonas testosteroni]
MSSVNFLEKLLGGVAVEWLPLGKVAKYSDSRIDSTYVNQGNYVGVDNLVQNRAGKQNSSYVPTDGRLIEYRKGDILIGNIRPYLKKIWLANNSGGASGDVLVIRSTHKSLSSEYLHQVLTDDKFFAYNMQHAKGAKMPRGDKAKILEYSIPIPCPDNPKKSLEIQAEIVRILDAMTAHTAELTAELTARKKQYNYYRDKLLSFEDGEVEWKTIEDIFDIFAGGDVPKEAFSESQNDEYNIPILSNGIDEKSLYGWTNKAKIDKPSLTVSARGTIGWTSYRDKPFFPIVRLIVLTPKTKISLKYAYYFMKTIEKNYKVPEAGIPQLTKPMIKDIKIPIPYPADEDKSLEAQNQIVAILDKFDALTTSITEGLPREIELRQKQYAYYRDLLLSFPKPPTI